MNFMVALFFIVSTVVVSGHYDGGYEGYGPTGPQVGPYKVNGPTYGPSEVDGPKYGPASLKGPSYGHAAVTGPKVAAVRIYGAVNNGARLSAPVFRGVTYIGGAGDFGGDGGAWGNHGYGYY